MRQFYHYNGTVWTRGETNVQSMLFEVHVVSLPVSVAVVRNDTSLKHFGLHVFTSYSQDLEPFIPEKTASFRLSLMRTIIAVERTSKLFDLSVSTHRCGIGTWKRHGIRQPIGRCVWTLSLGPDEILMDHLAPVAQMKSRADCAESWTVYGTCAEPAWNKHQWISQYSTTS